MACPVLMTYAVHSISVLNRHISPSTQEFVYYNSCWGALFAVPLQDHMLENLVLWVEIFLLAIPLQYQWKARLY